MEAEKKERDGKKKAGEFMQGGYCSWGGEFEGGEAVDWCTHLVKEERHFMCPEGLETGEGVAVCPEGGRGGKPWVKNFF